MLELSEPDFFFPGIFSSKLCSASGTLYIELEKSFLGFHEVPLHFPQLTE